MQVRPLLHSLQGRLQHSAVYGRLILLPGLPGSLPDKRGGNWNGLKRAGWN
jgi:hypothetical protein